MKVNYPGDIKKVIEQLQSDKNNAVAHVYKDAKNGKGLLENSTIILKDVYSTIDAPTQASSKILENFNSNYDAEIIRRIKEAGGAIVGKVHLDELALGGTGTYSAFGLITNPLDNSRIVGGSSSGNAATLTNEVTLSIGSDTGDSVRLPASYVGKVGFKPSYGAVSRYGLFSFASSLDTVAWFANDVNDAIIGASVLFGKDQKDMTSKEVEVPTLEEVKPKKVAFLDLANIIDERANEQYLQLKDKLIADGVEVETVQVDMKLLENIGTVYSIISFSEVSSNDSNLTGIIFGNREEGNDWQDAVINSRSKGLGRMVQKRFTLGSYFLEKDNQEKMFNFAKKVRRLIVNEFNKIYDNYDVLAFPATKIADKLADGKDDSWFADILSHSNMGGNPDIVVKFGSYDEMPFGLSLSSSLYSDKKLLSHALYFEKLIGGSND